MHPICNADELFGGRVVYLFEVTQDMEEEVWFLEAVPCHGSVWSVGFVCCVRVGWIVL
jgi:hypothetical protein